MARNYWYDYNRETEEEKDARMPGRIKKPAEWRGLFSSEMLKEASRTSSQNEINYFAETGTDGCMATIGAGRGRKQVRIYCAPKFLKDSWDKADFSCTCAESKRGNKCVHMAAVMVRWEKEHGPFILRERESEYLERIRQEEREKWKKEQDERRKNFGTQSLPALDYFGDRNAPGLVFYDFRKALEGYTTTAFDINEARRYQQRDRSFDGIRIEKNREGRESLHIDRVYYDEIEFRDIKMHMEGGTILSFYGDIGLKHAYNWGYNGKSLDYLGDKVLDYFALAVLEDAWDYADLHTREDQTDSAAEKFFRNMEKASNIKLEIEQTAEPVPKREILDLQPRIIVEKGQAKLSFKLGKGGKRLYVLRNLKEFVQCVVTESVLALSKTETVNFSELDFRKSSLPLYRFIERRVGEIRDVNRKLENQLYYGRYISRSFAMEYQQDLKGSLLDAFYDTYEGNSCEFQDKTNGIKDAVIKIAHTKMRFHLESERISDARGTFAGVAVSGFIPVMIKGSSFKYILNKTALSRITEEEERLLAPFRGVADAAGYFRFQVGRPSLQEFYYRVLPGLLENPCVEMEDNCGEEAEKYLPPEPQFVFYLDFDEGLEKLSARCNVTYGTRTCSLKTFFSDGEKKIGTFDNSYDSSAGFGKSPVPETETDRALEGDGSVEFDGLSVSREDRFRDYRDDMQERRVFGTLSELFNSYDPDTHEFYREADNDILYEFLQTGIASLSRFGEIRGTDAFRKQRVRPAPSVQIGISVESGIMDLSLTSKDMSDEELLDVLQSYQLKKRYYRLRSGEFVDLSQSRELSEINGLLHSMELLPTDVIKQKAHLPLYRALYLDRMLEEHEEIVTNRDRTYRTLVKNFKTLKDADYEPEQEISEILRPYQTYGFKWLKTLEAAGFGGILADEMGLGKTIQMISVFLSDKGGDPSLVVCPASLVFNWKEEINRFAPSLKVMPLSGPLSARKKALKDFADQDIYVISYDLLRHDIALFSDLHFQNVVLDEAQYIKNAKAAASKAVKVLKADHRYALTGTPIENRLAELHSIFDFLMPGFLYDRKAFETKFEHPIVKEKDEAATERLKRMTGPFILRRRKVEVLKDLPAKLEEVRYAEITGEQQRVYDAQVVRMKQMLASSGELKGEDRIRIFAELTRIREICCDPSLLFENYKGESAKREACLELIRNAMDGGHRMLVFSQFTSMLALLEEDLQKENIPYFKIIGATPKEKRIAMVHAFNEGDTPVFLISLKAGGTGLNLTGADVVIHYDPWWNLAAQNQATDRAHRIGQTREVTVFKLILKNTIEEKIMELQEAKRDLADAILEGAGESLMSLSGEELMDLLS
ncbi:MAG: DEAD/DEAH box helicase [Lachnospiraceae bacterium]|nr:DEAD/DEAH box helicase [Lachnospiraceae bacterium]